VRQKPRTQPLQTISIESPNLTFPICEFKRGPLRKERPFSVRTPPACCAPKLDRIYMIYMIGKTAALQSFLNRVNRVNHVHFFCPRKKLLVCIRLTVLFGTHASGMLRPQIRRIYMIYMIGKIASLQPFLNLVNRVNHVHFFCPRRSYPFCIRLTVFSVRTPPGLPAALQRSAYRF
jgi:hypothetical protein